MSAATSSDQPADTAAAPASAAAPAAAPAAPAAAAPPPAATAADAAGDANQKDEKKAAAVPVPVPVPGPVVFAQPVVVLPALKAVSAADRAAADRLKDDANKRMSARDFAGAEALYTQAMALDPRPASFVYAANRAQARLNLHRATDAALDCVSVLAAKPDHFKCWYRYGCALEVLGGVHAGAVAHAAFGRAYRLASDGLRQGTSNATEQKQALDKMTAASERAKRDPTAAAHATASAAREKTAVFIGNDEIDALNQKLHATYDHAPLFAANHRYATGATTVAPLSIAWDLGGSHTASVVTPARSVLVLRHEAAVVNATDARPCVVTGFRRHHAVLGAYQRAAKRAGVLQLGSGNLDTPHKRLAQLPVSPYADPRTTRVSDTKLVMQCFEPCLPTTDLSGLQALVGAFLRRVFEAPDVPVADRKDENEAIYLFGGGRHITTAVGKCLDALGVADRVTLHWVVHGIHPPDKAPETPRSLALDATTGTWSTLDYAYGDELRLHAFGVACEGADAFAAHYAQHCHPVPPTVVTYRT